MFTHFKFHNCLLKTLKTYCSACFTLCSLIRSPRETMLARHSSHVSKAVAEVRRRAVRSQYMLRGLGGWILVTTAELSALQFIHEGWLIFYQKINIGQGIHIMSTFLFTSSVPNIKGNWPPKSCLKNVSLVQSYLNRWASLFSPFSPVNPFANG